MDVEEQPQPSDPYGIVCSLPTHVGQNPITTAKEFFFIVKTSLRLTKRTFYSISFNLIYEVSTKVIISL